MLGFSSTFGAAKNTVWWELKGPEQFKVFPTAIWVCILSMKSQKKLEKKIKQNQPFLMSQVAQPLIFGYSWQSLTGPSMHHFNFVIDEQIPNRILERVELSMSSHFCFDRQKRQWPPSSSKLQRKTCLWPTTGALVFAQSVIAWFFNSKKSLCSLQKTGFQCS